MCQDILRNELTKLLKMIKHTPVNTQKFLTLLNVEIAPQANAKTFVSEVIVIATPLICIILPILSLIVPPKPACINPDNRINISSTPIPEKKK